MDEGTASTESPTRPARTGPRAGIVVIGRNEGDRLTRSLASALATSAPIVYVDSGSTDGSPKRAAELGIPVVELDPSRPFSAARARNEGFEDLIVRVPSIEFVQFVDGDCVLAEPWIACAINRFDERSELVVACGRLRELDAKASIYNRLCDLEWDHPPGEVERCGGLFMIRRSAFVDVDGFDPTQVAAEEPALCQRLLERGGIIERLAEPMAWHDADMHSFGQWWTRQERCAYGDTDAATRFGLRGLDVRSAWVWGVGWPLALVVTAIGGAAFALSSGPWALAVAAILLVALALPVQMLRVAWRRHRAGRSWPTSLLYGVFIMLGKWPRLMGQLKCRADQRRGITTRLIEYRAGPAPD